MNKALFFFGLLFCLPTLGNSQNLQHSIGLSINRFSFQPLEYLYFSNTQPEFYRRYPAEKTFQFPLSYHLKRKLVAFQNKPFDLSLDIPLEVALFWSTDRNNEDNHFVNLGLPLIITANYGAFTFTEKSNEMSFGIFGGAGAIWQLTRGNLGKKSYVSPHVLAGIRFKIKENRGIELSYAQNLFFKVLRTEEAGDEFYLPSWEDVPSIKYQTQYLSARFIF